MFVIVIAVDLGGVHTPASGSVTLDADNADAFDLVDGNVYEVPLFHAERQTEGSTFRLGLNGFGEGPSACGPLP